MLVGHLPISGESTDIADVNTPVQVTAAEAIVITGALSAMTPPLSEMVAPETLTDKAPLMVTAPVDEILMETGEEKLIGSEDVTVLGPVTE